MMYIDSIIVEDDLRHLEDLKELLKEYPFINVLAEVSTIEAAEKEILFHKPDLVFLDIRLDGEEDVFPMLIELEKRNLDFGIIFITAYYKEYIEKAVQACGFSKRFFYLEKPVFKKLLEVCLFKFKAIFDKKNQDRFIIRVQNGLYQITYDEIVYIETDGNDCVVFLSNGRKIAVSMNLSDMEANLPKEFFYRISKKHITHRAHLKESHILNASPRKYVCLLEKGKVKIQLNIPERKWKDFKKEFQHSLG
ncbi:MAG: LytR/AlgR family response regulator transcription factor [Saprospiraceae bacterium]